MKVRDGAILVAISLLFACSPKIQYQWKSPDYQDMNYQDVVVFGFSDIYESRLRTEQIFANVLEENGQSAKWSLQYISWQSEEDANSRLIVQELNKAQINGIITTTIRDQESESINVDGYNIPAYGGNFKQYHHAMYQSMRVPAELEKDKSFLVEINFYQLEPSSGDFKLRWNGQSKVGKPSNVKTFTKKFAQTIVSELKAQSILK